LGTGKHIDAEMLDEDGSTGENTVVDIETLEDLETETEAVLECGVEDEELLLGVIDVNDEWDVARVKDTRELDTLPALHFPVIISLAAAETIRKWYLTITFLASFCVAVVCSSQPKSDSCKE
jgi:hypothetical protein